MVTTCIFFGVSCGLLTALSLQLVSKKAKYASVPAGTVVEVTVVVELFGFVALAALS